MDAFKAALEQANGEPEVAAELLTGLSFEEMSKQLAEAWSLSETLSDSFDATTLTKEVKAINLGKMMSSGMEAGGGSKQLHAALKKMTRDFKMDIQRGMSMLRAGADEAIAMANEYGPDVGKALLSCETLADDKPADEKQPDEVSPAEAADKSEAGKNLDTNVESLQLVDDIENPEVAKPKNKLQESMDEQSLRMPNGSRLLELVDEVWDLAEGSKPIANVCKRVADGVKEACGFERVAVFIKVNKKEEIKLAYLAGSLTEHWTKDLVLPINDKNDSIFRYGVRSNGPVWVTPDKISDVEKLITPPVKALIGEQQRFALSPIKSGLRVVAVVYADMAGETLEFSDVHFDAFSRFIKQAGRALSSV